MNLEIMIATLIFFNKEDITNLPIRKEMFLNKDISRYLLFLQENIETGLSQYDLSQQFIQKHKIELYPIDYIEEQLKIFSIETLKQMFYTQAIENIWNEYKKSNKLKTDTTSIEDIHTITDEIKNILNEIESKKIKKNPFETFRKNISLLKENIDNGLAYEGMVGHSTGLEQLDMILKGMKPSDYVIIGARPSMGKTSLALDITAEKIKENKNVLVCSIEMRAEQLVARLIPKINSELTLDNTVNGIDINQNIEALYEASVFLENSGLEIEDFSDNIKVTAADIQIAVENYLKKHGFYPEIVIIDYIQKIQSKSNNKSENEIVTEASNMIQRLGKKTGSTFIVLSQLNRSLEERTDKRPMSSDLRNSGALEQDADIILFLYREAVYLERELKEKLKKKPDSQEIAEALLMLKNSEVDTAEIIVAKNRSGQIGTAFVEFHKPTASYINSNSYIDNDLAI